MIRQRREGQDARNGLGGEVDMGDFLTDDPDGGARPEWDKHELAGKQILVRTISQDSAVLAKNCGGNDLEKHRVIITRQKRL